MNERYSINPARLIVTGDAGFVGRHFCSRYGGIALADQLGRVDLCDAPRVHAAVAATMPAAVLHLAARSSVAESFKNPLVSYQVNFLGTLNLLEALKAIGFNGVFVYVSSAEVYGRVDDVDLPIREGHSLNPRSPYAVSKVAAEALCYQWSQTESFRIVMARPFNQIGAGQERQFAIPNFAHQIIEMRTGIRPPVLIAGNLDITRDFIDVIDAISAYKALLEIGGNGEIYNICSGQERSLRSLVERMLNIAGVRAEFEVDPSRLRPMEQMHMVGDPGKIYRQTGWKPELDLAATLTGILSEMETN